MKKVFALLLSLFCLNSVNAAELSPDTEMNKTIIQSLMEGGANPKAPHLLEHHFYCDTPKCTQLLLDKGKALGYQVDNTGDILYEGTRYWYGDLIKPTVLDLDLINKENEKMLTLANEFKANYGGWGTFIIKK